MEAPAICPERHLAALKRLVVGLEASCADILGGSGPAHGYASTMLMALLNLAYRGLAPSALKGGSALLLKMIDDSFFGQDKDSSDQEAQVNRLHLDKTPFAAHCCAFLSGLDGLSTDQCRKIVKALEHHFRLATKPSSKKIVPSYPDLLLCIAQDSLATGWAYEYLVENQKVIESAASPILTETNLAKTQFFTPSWIAAYLCAEAIGEKSNFTLLDPACGAGHLLVQAVQEATKAVDTQGRPERMAERLSELFGQSLYGLDIDSILVSLASFALYLCARDLLSQGNQSIAAKGLAKKSEINFINLPVPQLFCLEAPLGSLALGQNNMQIPVQVQVQVDTMRDTSGKTVRSTALPKAYDAIVMNPPYLSTRTMDGTTATFLKEHYQACSGDLYTAFMQLAMKLLKPGGRLSTVVQQSFLSISRYRTFRLDLLKNARLISCVQLGTGAFPSRPGEKVNNAIITLQKYDSEADSQEHVIRFLRLQGKGDHDLVKASGLANYPHQTISHADATTLIKSLAGQPFAFHCPQEIAQIFQDEPSLAVLSSDFVLTNGLFTCDNQRFVRLASTLKDDEVSAYVPYDKGGGQKWYSQTPYSLHWGQDGQAIRDFRAARGQSKSLPGEGFYFQPGLTYSYIGTKGFSARLLSPGAIFDIASSAVFSLKHDLNYVLGFFNSALIAYLLGILNPTINFQIGDLRKLPFKAPDSQLESTVADLAGQAIGIVQIIQGVNGSKPPSAAEVSGLVKREREIQTCIDALIFDHYAVSKPARQAVLEDAWVQRGRKLITGDTGLS
jgi:hypothetical protein